MFSSVVQSWRLRANLSPRFVTSSCSCRWRNPAHHPLEAFPSLDPSFRISWNLSSAFCESVPFIKSFINAIASVQHNGCLILPIWMQISTRAFSASASGGLAPCPYDFALPLLDHDHMVEGEISELTLYFFFLFSIKVFKYLLLIRHPTRLHDANSWEYSKTISSIHSLMVIRACLLNCQTSFSGNFVTVVTC